MKSTLEILQGARDLIDLPSKWSIGHYAQNEDSSEVNVYDEEACKFCPSGALLRALDPPAEIKEEVIKLTWGHNSLANWEDMNSEPFLILSKHIIEAAAKQNAMKALRIISSNSLRTSNIIDRYYKGESFDFWTSENAIATMSDSFLLTHKDIMEVFDMAISEAEKKWRGSQNVKAGTDTQ